MFIVGHVTQRQFSNLCCHKIQKQVARKIAKFCKTRNVLSISFCDEILTMIYNSMEFCVHGDVVIVSFIFDATSVQVFSTNCYLSLLQNEHALRHVYALSNLCEEKIPAEM